MPNGNQLDFETVCKFVGQLYLESRGEIERAAAQLEKSHLDFQTATKDKEDALRLLMERPRVGP